MAEGIQIHFGRTNDVEIQLSPFLMSFNWQGRKMPWWWKIIEEQMEEHIEFYKNAPDWKRTFS